MGHLPALSVPGVGHLQILRCPGAGHMPTHAVFYQNLTTQRILLEKQEDWLICHGQEKIEEVCKGMSSILCTHFFIAYQPRITWRNSGAIDMNQRFLVIGSSFS